MSLTELAVAFTAGVVSFASPCVLPLVPVYLSVTTGLGVAELAGHSRGRSAAVARGAGWFVVGFSAVFVALGLSATAVGRLLLREQVPITRVAGIVVVAMALVMVAATTRYGGLVLRERRFHLDPTRRHRWAAPVAGAAFAFGWTPCIGPVLGSVLAMAASHQRLLTGGVLLATYSAGLGLPLLLTGLAFDRAVGPLRWTRRHAVAVARGAAVLMGCYGALLVTDRLSWLTRTLQTGFTPPV